MSSIIHRRRMFKSNLAVVSCEVRGFYKSADRDPFGERESKGSNMECKALILSKVSFWDLRLVGVVFLDCSTSPFLAFGVRLHVESKKV